MSFIIIIIIIKGNTRKFWPKVTHPLLITVILHLGPCAMPCCHAASVISCHTHRAEACNSLPRMTKVSNEIGLYCIDRWRITIQRACFMHILRIILKVMTKSWWGTNTLLVPNQKVGGLVSSGPHGRCAAPPMDPPHPPTSRIENFKWPYLRNRSFASSPLMLFFVQPLFLLPSVGAFTFIDFWIKFSSLLNSVKAGAFAWYSVKICVIFGVQFENRKVDEKEIEICKLYSGVFWIVLSNIIKIDPYNFELYRFKAGPFFEAM